MSRSDEVKERIISVFAKELDRHLFSEKNIPKQVTISTEYEECTQSITIYFNNIQED